MSLGISVLDRGYPAHPVRRSRVNSKYLSGDSEASGSVRIVVLWASRVESDADRNQFITFGVVVPVNELGAGVPLRPFSGRRAGR